MAEVTFLIPEKDAARARALEMHLRDVVGLKQVRVVHQPFNPFSADAEMQTIAESRVTVVYDPDETTIERITRAFTALHIHLLHVHANG